MYVSWENMAGHRMFCHLLNALLPSFLSFFRQMAPLLLQTDASIKEHNNNYLAGATL